MTPAPPMLPLPRTPRRRRLRRALIWSALVLLLVVAQTLLVALTINYESSRLQDAAESAAVEAASEVRRELLQAVQALQGLAEPQPLSADWQRAATALLQRQPALLRLERRDAARRIIGVSTLPAAPALFAQIARADLEVDAEFACAQARRVTAPSFSRSYFVPLRSSGGMEVIDLCLPLGNELRDGGYLVGTFSLAQLLESALPPAQRSRWELSFVESDGARLARSGPSRGASVYVANRLVDLPGRALQLRADSTGGRPSLIPNLITALVLGLSLALFALVLLLARDVRRRGEAERALAEALAFRQAMEDSLITGLRARDLQGHITYVNPAFCVLVGFSAAELRQPTPPYWPPERAPEYASRQAARLDLSAALRRESREGFETEFMRKNGERFPVMIYEAPLVDGDGRHTGWMSAVVDLSAQRRIEEISRQQQDRLQASARLATVGEMASLLSHELNQPLSAIASYASGSLNLLAPSPGSTAAAPDGETVAMLRQALSRIEEQAGRAGLVIKSVHDFVRRREQHHERITADVLIDAVLPLVRLQARKSGTRIELEMPRPAPGVVCDRTMLEQVLLNLTRNGIQAMETDTPLAERVLTLRVQQSEPRRVSFSVGDAGHGIAPAVAAKLFTPFFTTRAEGMGLGLSLCRTVIEQHGGTLEFGLPAQAGRNPGAEFRFTLAAAPPTSANARAPPA